MFAYIRYETGLINIHSIYFTTVLKIFSLVSKSRRHQLEWSFGRIQIALEKLNEMNEDVKRKQETLKSKQ